MKDAIELRIRGIKCDSCDYNNMKYTAEIAPLYRYQFVYDLCEKIDKTAETNVSDCEMFKITLLSAMCNIYGGNTGDQGSKVYLDAIQSVREDTIAKSPNPELLIGYYPFV
ncbi:hypothetical protein [Ammoniphilus resinae]|uniref:Uncharacterized protein n=1 Tax=Ammoniphilus resinae TaxID=861532 RepID=A0ABS4GNB9_9BACL|nr:hypothetical protein [Ammoniphilus resinae]MBP1931769.1 hypothetical protein [Ammoniphilus resinae]